MKRFLATFLAMVMCFSFAPMAFATDISTASAETDTLTDDEGWVALDTVFTVEDNQLIPMAGGTETWAYTGWKSVPVGSFTMEGNNLTPVKTLDPTASSSVPLNLEVSATYSCSTSVRLTLQIRKAYSSKVLAEDVSYLGTSGGAVAVAEGLSAGDKVQIFFRIVKGNGSYDDNLKCNISYNYGLCYNDY